MDVSYFRTLYDYNYWARDQLLAALVGISDGDYQRENGFTYGSIAGILTHCLTAERVWRLHFQGKLPDPTREAELATPALLAETWRREEEAMRGFLAQLSSDDLARSMTWQRRDGTTGMLSSLWLGLAHVANHSTQHRSEAAEALTMIGRSPGDLDLLVYGSLTTRNQT